MTVLTPSELYTRGRIPSSATLSGVKPARSGGGHVTVLNRSEPFDPVFAFIYTLKRYLIFLWVNSSLLMFSIVIVIILLFQW